jgi:hypothetical protein
MKLIEAKENIGKTCTIGGGDVAINSDLRPLVFNNDILVISAITKGGLVRLKKDNSFYTVAAKYVHLV